MVIMGESLTPHQRHRHLLLNLESPLMSFGGVAVDNFKSTRRFPGASTLTGLLANALGWRRIERERHQRLQDRLLYAARVEREIGDGLPLRDFQTGKIAATDKGWTTWGKVEGRKGGAASYNSPTLLYNEYLPDARVVAALRLRRPDESPTLDDLQAALIEPARVLFIGRKPCIPSSPLFAGFARGDTALDALINAPLVESPVPIGQVSVQWSDDETEREDAYDLNRLSPVSELMVSDKRNWLSGLHGGERLVYEGFLPATAFGRDWRAV